MREFFRGVARLIRMLWRPGSDCGYGCGTKLCTCSVEQKPQPKIIPSLYEYWVDRIKKEMADPLHYGYSLGRGSEPSPSRQYVQHIDTYAYHDCIGPFKFCGGCTALDYAIGLLVNKEGNLRQFVLLYDENKYKMINHR